MALLDRTSTLAPIREKLISGERLGLEDGLALLESDELLEIGELADLARRLRGGTDEVSFVQNLYISQTNVCRVKCKFCAFAATQKQGHAYTTATEELVRDAVPIAADEDFRFGVSSVNFQEAREHILERNLLLVEVSVTILVH